jgi:5-methylcytosine-specific restriction endonuclease McrA
VYLPESCFKALAKVCPSGSAAKKCAQYLSNNPVRAYRNAIAHSNWTYRKDFQAIVYWAKKGSEENEPLVRFEVEQDDLAFWQALSRCVAYAAFSNL